MAKGANLDVRRTDTGATPLHIAIAKYRLEIVELLVTKGASLNVCCINGATPLYMAVRYGYLDIVKILVAKGAKLDMVGANGKTPLYTASQYKYVEIAKFLLEQGADIDAVCSEDDSTPFHVAVYNGDISMVTMLLEKGADINKPLYDGTTTLETASSRGFSEIKQIIEQYKDAQAVFKAKIHLAHSVAVKISKVFSAFAYPPIFLMTWRNEQDKKCAATIATQLSAHPEWSFDKCKNYVTTTIESIKTDQCSGLARLLKQLDKFAPEQAVSSQKNNSNSI